MGLNWSEGLNRAGEGLGRLADHAIYKDEAARRARLDAASQSMQERLLALREKQFESDTEFRGKGLELDERRTESAELASEAQIEQGSQRIDLAGEANDLAREDMAFRREQVQAATERAQAAAEAASNVASAEEYTELTTDIDGRLDDLVKSRLEILSEMAENPHMQGIGGKDGKGPDPRAQQMELLDQQTRNLLAEKNRMDMRFDRFNESSFTDNQKTMLDALQERNGIDLAGAVAHLSTMTEGDLALLADDLQINKQELEEEINSAATPSAGASPEAAPASDEFIPSKTPADAGMEMGQALGGLARDGAFSAIANRSMISDSIWGIFKGYHGYVENRFRFFGGVGAGVADEFLGEPAASDQ